MSDSVKFGCSLNSPMEPTWQAADCARSNARRPAGDLRKASSFLGHSQPENQCITSLPYSAFEFGILPDISIAVQLNAQKGLTKRDGGVKLYPSTEYVEIESWAGECTSWMSHHTAILPAT